jgi:hypothetical protein
VSLFLCVAIPTLLRADPGRDAKAPARVAFTAELRLPELTRFALFRDPEAEHLDLHRPGEPLFAGTDPIPLGKVVAVREESLVIFLTGGQTVEILKGGRLPGRRVLIFERSVLLDTLRFQVRYGTPTAPPGAGYSVVELRGRQAILQRDALPGEGQATGGVAAEAGRPADSLAALVPPGATSRPPADKLADLVNRMPLREVAPDTWEVPTKDAMALESHVGELLAETLRSSTLSLTSQSGVALNVETSLGTGTLDRQGFLINSLKLAQRMGLEMGDRILFVNDHAVNSLASLYHLYRSLKSDPGVSEVKVVVTRRSQIRTVTYRLR